ncbi:DUF3298 domain-containing protein [bacterium]|nr:MAG: DUF3298 domain-containing protein [bacterium]
MLFVLATLALQVSPTVPSDFVAKNGKTKVWDAQVFAPRLKTGAGRALAAKVGNDEKAAMNAWVAQVKSDLKDYRPDRIQTYEATPEYAYERGQVASSRMMVFYDNGGAHPNTVYRNYNFWGTKPLSLSGCFNPGFDGSRHVSYLLMEKLVKNPNATFVQDGSVRELTPQQLEQFVVTPKGLVWTFSPYELGPYVVGAISQLLKPEDLGPNFRLSMLQGR